MKVKRYIAPGYYVLEEDWLHYLRIRGNVSCFIHTDDWVDEDDRIFNELHSNYVL